LGQTKDYKNGICCFSAKHWVDDNDLLTDEQNGFRKERSTVDQLYSLTNIIEVRKKLRKSSFCAITHCVNLSFKILQYSLYETDASAIPL
jgi:hypothetical protein